MDVSFSKFTFLLENSSFITGNKYHPLFSLMWQSRFFLLRRSRPHAQLRTTAVCASSSFTSNWPSWENRSVEPAPQPHSRAVRGLPRNAERLLTASPAQSWHTGICSYCVSPVAENPVPLVQVVPRWQSFIHCYVCQHSARGKGRLNVIMTRVSISRPSQWSWGSPEVQRWHFKTDILFFSWGSADLMGICRTNEWALKGTIPALGPCQANVSRWLVCEITGTEYWWRDQ